MQGPLLYKMLPLCSLSTWTLIIDIRSEDIKLSVVYILYITCKQPEMKALNDSLVSNSPGSALRRQEVKKSAVKWMSTSQKNSRTFWWCLHALAPTSNPRPRENSSFIWISVKLLNRVSLEGGRQLRCIVTYFDGKFDSSSENVQMWSLMTAVSTFIWTTQPGCEAVVGSGQHHMTLIWVRNCYCLFCFYPN